MDTITLESLTRQERLLVWLRRSGISCVELGEKLGISKSGVSRYFRGDTMPSRHVQKLIDLGIPAELLPAPEDKPRGKPARRVLS